MKIKSVKSLIIIIYAKNEISNHISELEIDTINNFDFEVDNSIESDVKNQLLNLFKTKLFI